MSVDPYGYATSGFEAPAGCFSRWSVTVAWLPLDLVVLLCTGAFTAFAWEGADDPPFIVLFSSPFVGGAVAGTVVAALLGLTSRHPALQVFGSLLFAAVAFCACPTLWFFGLVLWAL